MSSSAGHPDALAGPGASAPPGTAASTSGGPAPSTNAGPRVRAAMAAIPGYAPGAPAPVGPDGGSWKASSNENPFPPLPAVLDVVARAAADLNRYPDLAAVALRTAIGASLQVPPERIVPSTGSVAVLGHVVQTVCDAGDEVVFAWRSFEAYPILVQLAGAVAVPVPLDVAGRHDLDAMVQAITDRTRLVLLCTPNNPTGPALGAQEVDAFLDRVPDDVLVVIDEAYAEFVRDPTAVDGLAVHGQRANVAVLRTFSKAHGLAGLRVGYAVAHEPFADALRKACLPFGVSALAQQAAIASLEAIEQLMERVDVIVDERERVAAALAAQGWRLPRSEANFVWLPVGSSTPDLARACADVGLSVRPYGADGVRATVGDPVADDRLLEVCEAFLRTWSPDRVG